MVLKTRADAEEVARGLYQYLQDCLVDIHVATEMYAKSKSVAMFIPAKFEREEDSEAPLVVGGVGAARKTVNFVKSATYLGHIISTTLTDSKHLKSRMSKAAQVFGALGKNVFRNKQVWKMVKAQILKSMILPVLLDGAECCVISAKVMAEMETLYHRFIRSCLRISPYTQRKYKLSSEELLRRMGMEPLHYYLDLKILAYAGHIVRMPNYRLPKIVRSGHVRNTRESDGIDRLEHKTKKESENTNQPLEFQGEE
jgi:hypothetical protein